MAISCAKRIVVVVVDAAAVVVHGNVVVARLSIKDVRRRKQGPGIRPTRGYRRRMALPPSSQQSIHSLVLFFTDQRIVMFRGGRWEPFQNGRGVVFGQHFVELKRGQHGRQH